MREVIDREFRGGSRGVSVPIAKGVRFRTGSFRGKSVVGGSHMGSYRRRRHDDDARRYRARRRTSAASESPALPLVTLRPGAKLERLHAHAAHLTSSSPQDCGLL
jgi:hypothetical protein